jgi:hypothetical protein
VCSPLCRCARARSRAELVDHPPVPGRVHRAGRDVEVGLARERRARGRVHAPRDLEAAEALAEGDLLLVVEGLAGEDQHGVLVEGGADRPPGRVVQGAREVGALDAGGEVQGKAGHRDGHPGPPSCGAGSAAGAGHDTAAGAGHGPNLPYHQ